MSAAALTLYETDGVTVMWDSDSVAGGVLADVRSYQAGDTATLTYPAFAGRNVDIINLLAWDLAGTVGVVADTALGYPRVTVSTAGSARKFIVQVF